MKTHLVLLGVALVVFSGLGKVTAAPLSFNVNAERKRFDVERSQTASTMTTKEKWGYNVVLENKSFQDLDNLEVKYRVFYLDDDRNSSSHKGKLKSSEGTAQIAALKNSAKFTFETTPVSLSESQLKDGWIDGKKKAKAQDSVAGIWIKIFKNGEVAFEYAEPQSLKSKAEWK